MNPLTLSQSGDTAATSLSRQGAPALKRNYLSGFESIAQTLGTLAPSGTMGVVIPLLIGKSGNGTWLLFLVVLGICVLILFNLNAFATRSSSSGGLTSFVRLGLGEPAGAVTGWIYIGAMLFGAASSAPSAAYYACIVISKYTPLTSTPVLAAATIVLVVAVAWWTAVRDMKLSSDVMIVIEAASLAVMIAIVAIVMVRTGSWIDKPQLTLEGVGPRAFTSGLVLAFLTIGGFESATTLGDEAKNAKVTIPRAILRCVLPVAGLYLVMTYLLVGLGRQYGLALDQLDAPFDTLANANHLSLLGTASSIGVALSYFACVLGSINAGARTLYSLAERGLFWAPFGRAHPHNATPHRAIALFGAVGIAVPVVLLLAGTALVSAIDYLSQLSALGFIGSYFMVCLAAPFYLRRLGELSFAAVAVSVAALLLLCIVMVLSVYPAPATPACYLPYIFLGIIGLGVAASLTSRRSHGI